jgi:hypothetical protein
VPLFSRFLLEMGDTPPNSPGFLQFLTVPEIKLGVE